ncbi:MAG: TIGR02147 family protein [Proteobacteria bacterium]|nr:MAG: TIGR02147 family protein [Pseudomonadota bacterium]
MTDLNIFNYKDYRDYILDLFRIRAERNHRFSSNGFAKKLGIYGSQMSQIRSRTDSIGVKTAEKISKHLKFNEKEAKYLSALVLARRDGCYLEVNKLQEIHQYHIMQNDLCGLLSQDDFIVFVKIKILGHIYATAEDAKRVGRDPEYLWAACERLTTSGYLEGNRDNGWSTKLSHVLNTEAQQKLNRAYHQQYFMQVAEGFHKSPEERYFFSTVYTLSRKDYEAVCKKIQEFLMDFRMSDTLETEHDTVYTIGVQVVPIESIDRGHGEKKDDPTPH